MPVWRIHLVAENEDFRGRLETNANLIASDRNHCDSNVVADDDLLVHLSA
jgi:hypothetical protein